MNVVEFSIDNYVDDNTSLNGARLLMINDVIFFINTLLNNKYIAVIKENQDDLITVEYEYSNYHYENQIDTKNPYWITKSDYYTILSNKKMEKEFYNKLP